MLSLIVDKICSIYRCLTVCHDSFCFQKVSPRNTEAKEVARSICRPFNEWLGYTHLETGPIVSSKDSFALLSNLKKYLQSLQFSCDPHEYKECQQQIYKQWTWHP